jgi:hypothetical protein
LIGREKPELEKCVTTIPTSKIPELKINEGTTSSHNHCSLVSKRDLGAELTVFLLTVGEEINFRECVARINDQTVRFRLEIVDHVAPLSKALQEMLTRCQTRYFVELDEDMLLFPNALEDLYNRIVDLPANTAFVCGGLWDCYMATAIHGVKIYDHHIVSQFPFEDVAGSDWNHYLRLRRAGYQAAILPLGERSSCFGEHGRHYTPETIFRRWRRLVQKHRRYGNMPWVAPWPKNLLDRVRRGGTVLDVYALLGAVSGLLDELPGNHESDWRSKSPEFECLMTQFGLDWSIGPLEMERQ